MSLQEELTEGKSFIKGFAVLIFILAIVLFS
jgi:hypothetical protein